MEGLFDGLWKMNAFLEAGILYWLRRLHFELVEAANLWDIKPWKRGGDGGLHGFVIKIAYSVSG